jgi:hypothetical protein
LVASGRPSSGQGQMQSYGRARWGAAHFEEIAQLPGQPLPASARRGATGWLMPGQGVVQYSPGVADLAHHRLWASPDRTTPDPPSCSIALVATSLTARTNCSTSGTVAPPQWHRRSPTRAGWTVPDLVDSRSRAAAESRRRNRLGDTPMLHPGISIKPLASCFIQAGRFAMSRKVSASTR